MPRINIHLDPETARRMQRAARTAGLSQNCWIANLVRAKVSCEWPESVVHLAGAWADLPTADELRSSLAGDLPREPL